MKKATIESLIADKEKGKYQKKKTRTVEVPSIGYSFELHQPTLSKLLDMMNEAAEQKTASDGIRFMCEIVYEACPMLHNKELIEAFDCKEPPEVVLAVLNDDIGALSVLSNEVLSFFGLADIEDMVKN